MVNIAVIMTRLRFDIKKLYFGGYQDIDYLNEKYYTEKYWVPT